MQSELHVIMHHLSKYSKRQFTEYDTVHILKRCTNLVVNMLLQKYIYSALTMQCQLCDFKPDWLSVVEYLYTNMCVCVCVYVLHVCVIS